MNLFSNNRAVATLSALFRVLFVMCLFVSTDMQCLAGNRLYPVKNDEGKYGFMDRKGNLIVPYKYDDIYNFSEGLAAVCLNDKWGYIDNTGVEVVPCKYSDCTSFRSAIAFVCDKITCKWGSGKDKH